MVGFALLVMLAVAAGLEARHGRAVPSDHVYRPHSKGTLTFNKDVAPIVFENCSGCHRPGQSAPFPLLEFSDVKKRSASIAKVVSERLMPPWLPEEGGERFLFCRRLSAEQVGIVAQWVAEGAVEGAAGDLPPLPKWNNDWYLGTPDLVVTTPKTYQLAAEGRDVYRNFAVPLTGLATQRFVRAIEFRPSNPRIVHHAFMRVVNTAQWERVDGKDGQPGFPGMSLSDEMPTGHFLSWQPGRLPVQVPEGLSWPLKPGQDLILQTHLIPSGKPENFQARIGIYFTDEAPTNTPFKMALSSYTMDIPAGESNYVVQDRFTLPVDVQLLALLPHAHYLAKEMRGWATFPDGREEDLILIKQWDFNWQGDYRYKNPMALPKGTKVSMRYTYDNSTNNIRNPNNPPIEVKQGSNSTDEMAELWLQLLPNERADLEPLTRAYQAHLARNIVEGDLFTLRANPRDAKAHLSLGMLYYQQKKFEEAAQHLNASIASDPAAVAPHYTLGVLYRRQNNLAAARHEFEAVLRLDASDARAHGNLGFVLAELGYRKAALNEFSIALSLNPDDEIARDGYNELLKAGVR